ncbi:MAG: hypothetical protein IJM97_01985 [Clostridia bacterium]|nr:hypothetical protein [Clostridia bacterium]
MMNKSRINGYFSAKIKEGKVEITSPVTYTADFTYEIADRFVFDRFANGIVPIEEMKKQLISALNTILTREYMAPTPLEKVEDISKEIYIPLMNHAVTKWDIIWGIKLTSAKLTYISVSQEVKDKLPKKKSWFRK